MKLPVSNKTASFGKKPWIKKGYYPAKLLKVTPYASKDGVLIKGNYGHQLIFEFAIYLKDEHDAPVSPMMFKEGDKDEVPVRISKFVYHEYNAKDPKEGEPLFQTAITANSAITVLLKALGWKFPISDDQLPDVDIEPLVGNWIEVNIDDFKTKSKEGEEYTASTIKDVNPYAGPEVKDVEDVKPTEAPKKVEKQMSHEDAKESEEIEKLKTQVEQLKELHTNGHLTDAGWKQAKESLETQIEGLKKK